MNPLDDCRIRQLTDRLTNFLQREIDEVDEPQWFELVSQISDLYGTLLAQVQVEDEPDDGEFHGLTDSERNPGMASCLPRSGRTYTAMALPAICLICTRQDSTSPAPMHGGSARCESGSIASGGTRTHCTCDICF